MANGRLKRESNPVQGEKPGYYPQHETDTAGDFETTGKRNPLPTTDSIVLAKLQEMDDKIQGIIDGSSPANTQLTGSNIEELIFNQREVVNTLRSDKLVLGVYWGKTANPTLTRIDASEGLEANAGVDGQLVKNDFDRMPIYSEISEVQDVYGNTFVRIPKFYIKKRDGATFKTWQISKTRYPGFYLPWCFWDFDNNIELDYVDVGKHKASLSGEGRLESKPNKQPLVSKNIVEFRNYARANNDDTAGIKGYQQYDLHVYDAISTLFYVEFATLDSQSVMRGFTSGAYSDSHTVTMTETGVNRVVVANATADQFVIGQSISAGASRGNASVFYGRTITSITVVDASNKALLLDGEPVSVTSGNVVFSTGWASGFASDIASYSGSVGDNTSGKYPCIYRGIESPWGDIWQFIDGVNFNDNQSWVAKNADDYASNVFASPYEKLSYINSNQNGYLEKTGWDSTLPFAEFATSVGSASYYGDYYYQNTGQRIARVGGGWNYGSAAGLSCWSLDFSSGSSGVGIGGRLLKKPL